ncbi:MAG: outer membrane lipoprotein-sorting protein [Desulfobacula sp.]|nr:outer membrane lipoprotein-sorting protein [Desulfobacula sp.]
MKTLFFLLVMAGTAFGQPNFPDAEDIMNKVDANLTSDSRVFNSKMIVHGTRSSRTIESKSYYRGNNDSFTKYLSPSREKGNKMLKLGNRLWIYSRTTDRVIKISGHMLRQSVAGSDLSYEDMMEVREMTEIYTATVKGESILDNRKTWVMDLKAKVKDVAYEHCKVWIDQERFIPLREELYAKSGQLLKKTVFSHVIRIQDRWFPMQVNFKDMLKKGKGTDFVITEIEFNPEIPDYIFSKASLRK